MSSSVTDGRAEAYLAGVAEGKPHTVAAVDAGYSPSYAHRLSVSRPDLVARARELARQRLIDRGATPEHAADRVADALDAVRPAGRDGPLIADHSARLQAADRVFALHGIDLRAGSDDAQDGQGGGQHLHIHLTGSDLDAAQRAIEAQIEALGDASAGPVGQSVENSSEPTS